MDELNFAEETTARMKDLYGLARNHEVIRRTILSQIYCSARHLSRYLLRQARNVHRRVIMDLSILRRISMVMSVPFCLQDGSPEFSGEPLSGFRFMGDYKFSRLHL